MFDSYSGRSFVGSGAGLTKRLAPEFRGTSTVIFFFCYIIVKLEVMNLPALNESIVIGKKVFVRGDIDVPLEQGVIKDDTRLVDIWPTLEFLLSKNALVTLAGHIGRPGGKVVPELSTRPVIDWVRARGGEKVKVLENLRFDPREEANDGGFAKELAGLADIYVNEAFAVAEREHASLVGVPRYLPHFAGFRLVKEMETLGGLLDHPSLPMVVIIGGAKLETKMPLIAKMANLAEAVVVGGKLLSEIKVGSPIMGMEKVKNLRLTPDGKDVTLDSVDRMATLISSAGTIVWNGPLGMIEDYVYQVGTRRIAELIAVSKAYKVVGGGDTVGFLKKLSLVDRFDFVSTGGGSMLKFLAGEKLPGVEALLE